MMSINCSFNSIKMLRTFCTRLTLICLTVLGVYGTAIAQDPCDGMKCISNVNLSLDENCVSTITPGMFIQDLNFPPGDYVIEVYDHHGVQQDLTFGIEDVGETFEVKVFLPQCNNNSCWSYMTVEYKLPPELDCPDDLTISCGGLDVLGLPTATAACGGLDFRVTLHNETRERLDCDPDYTHRIVRTYRATDEMGNFDECSHEILLERVDLSNIMFPENRTVATNNAISCNDETYIFDENGIPLPWLYSSITGSGSGFVGSGTSGVPFICDPNITDGVFCPLTGSGNGAPLIPMGGATDITFEGEVILVPGAVNQVCNSVVLYTDLELPQVGTGCVRKVMRTWEVREWWCNGENTTGGVQLIEIVDDEAPEFECPEDMTVTTNDYCAAAVELPGVDAYDECGSGIIVQIDFPKGFINGNGGLADLDVGDNIVTYIVSDSCYNSSSCSLEVTVRDDTEPVTICEQTTVVSISLNGTTLVYADSFDDGSWDECGLDGFAVRRMDTTCIAADTLFDESVSFCCADAGSEVMVVFRAYDLGGNYNDCMVRVQVQDKDIPLISCPADVTIDCREAYDLNNLGLVFGQADVTDNCAAQQVVTETVSTDVNQCGIGEIVREFELRSLDSVTVYRTCKQRITVVNFTPFVESNIQWPLDYDTTGVCNYNIGPDELPELYSYPQFLAGDDECSLLGWDYEDRIFETRDGLGECAYIERTWSVINWCSQINGSFEVFTIPQPQIIRIYNNVFPVIEPQNDTIVESFNIDCQSGLIEITRSGSDDCDSLFWSYEVRDSLDGLVAVGNSATYTDTIPNGEYSILWTVSDLCGNIATDDQNLTVINTKAAIPICINGFTVSLEEETNNGMTEYIAELWATDFDGGSYHPCGNPITFSMSSDTTVRNISFDCEDVGEQMVNMWVTDVITGVQDFCITTIEVLDNPNCPQMMNLVDVEGDIYTEMLEEVSEVEVKLDGSELEDMTGTTGHYTFGDMPMGGDYEIRPKKDGNDLNGVSTLDVIMIQRHILGIESLNSPYKLIAADVDRSEEISAKDLIEMRRLILGLSEEFSNSDSWRFVDAALTFVDPQDPWASGILETYEIENLDADMQVDFIGMKVGDVNNSAVANSSAKGEDIDTDKALEFELTDFAMNAGELYELEFKAQNYTAIAGWQGTVEFDNSKIEVLAVEGVELDLEEGLHLNLDNLEEGYFTLSYSEAEGRSMEDGDVLFKVTVMSKQTGVNSSEMALTSGHTKAEAYYQDNRIVPLSKTSNKAEGQLAIRNIAPNPWVERANVNFYLPQSSDVRFEFFDVTGKELYNYEQHFESGENSLRVLKSQINSSGVIYVRISTDYAQTQTKMLVID